jgi:hypothetical protein
VSDPIKRWKINRSGWMEGCESGGLVMYEDHAKSLESANTRITLLEQTLREIANADTVAWDDPTEYEAWAKSRARWALGKVEREKS